MDNCLKYKSNQFYFYFVDFSLNVLIYTIDTFKIPSVSKHGCSVMASMFRNFVIWLIEDLHQIVN